MKKVFWTSLVWIVLFGSFLLYMKWFNQPLAIGMADFLIKWEENTITEKVDLNESLVNEVETEMMSVEVTGVLLNMDKEPEITSSQYLIDKNWMKLFDQLDRIELIANNKTEDVKAVNEEAKPSEEMFDEFKTWYEKNKK